MLWARKMTTPRIKVTVSPHFNHRVQTDLFFIFDKTFIILVHECLRYCIIEHLPRKTAMVWMQTVFQHWIRYFGPMYILATDQEGAITSDLVSMCCERFNIDREFGGSQGHTAAPVAERRIQVIQLAAQKLWASVQRLGLQVTQEQVV
jgi:hypothetical protein